MATLQRFARHSNLIFKNSTRCRCQFNIARPMSNDKTSKEITNVGNSQLMDKSEEFQRLKEHFMDDDPSKMKNWSSHGWSDVDRDLDLWHHNTTMFALFTIVLVGGSFLFWYTPDFRLRDWIHREAFLDLDRREKKGLPAIDPYFVPPETVILPSEEELGDTEIII